MDAYIYVIVSYKLFLFVKYSFKLEKMTQIYIVNKVCYLKKNKDTINKNNPFLSLASTPALLLYSTYITIYYNNYNIYFYFAY